MSDVKDKLCSFIRKHINDQPLDEDSDIFKLGYVNSIFALQLINYIEKEFNINVKNDELKIDHFNSLENMTKFVTSKIY